MSAVAGWGRISVRRENFTELLEQKNGATVDLPPPQSGYILPIVAVVAIFVEVEHIKKIAHRG